MSYFFVYAEYFCQNHC